MTEKPKFAVFDIDGTLLRWQFFHAIVNELGDSGLIDAAAHDSIKTARMRWKNREHHEAFSAYEKVMVQTYLKALENIDETAHNKAIDAVFEEYKDQLFTYTRDLLKRSRKEGRLIFVISGSHEVILAKLAMHVGIDAFIGGEYEFKDGRFTGKRTTPFGDKAAALNRLVEQHHATFADSIAIGDSESDIAMLELVDSPIAFNPSRGLLEEAKKHGWKIVLERKNVVYELEQNKDGSYVLA